MCVQWLFLNLNWKNWKICQFITCPSINISRFELRTCVLQQQSSFSLSLSLSFFFQKSNLFKQYSATLRNRQPSKNNSLRSATKRHATVAQTLSRIVALKFSNIVHWFVFRPLRCSKYFLCSLSMFNAHYWNWLRRWTASCASINTLFARQWATKRLHWSSALLMVVERRN